MQYETSGPCARRLRQRLLPALAVAAGLVGATLAAAGTSLVAPLSASAASSLPCDIYASGGTPCVAAYSTTRALYGSYNGALYQVQRASDGAKVNIGVISAGSVANAGAQDSFCAGTTCTITMLFDQSPNGNNLPISDGGYWKGPGPNGSDIGANATALPTELAGHNVYAIKAPGGVGYRTPTNINAVGVPTGAQPVGVYMITSSNYYDQWCCYDFGLGETSHTDTGNGTMNAIEWGNACWLGGCSGPGPWVEADLENGMYTSSTGPNPPSVQGINFPYVTAWEKNNGTTNFTLKYGNAQSGGLSTEFSGALPNGYDPMKMQPDVLLGTGGDNSNSGQGVFYEGAIVSGYPSDATESAVQAEIAGAGYGSSTGSMSGGGGGGFANPPTGTYKIQNVNSGLLLGIVGASTQAGALANQWTDSGNADHLWTVVSAGYGTFKLRNGNSGLLLGISGASTQAGADALQWTDNGTSDHLWNFISVGNGEYKIENVNSGLLLGVQGASTQAGADAVQWYDNGHPDHLWRLLSPTTTATTTTTTTSGGASNFPSGYHQFVVDYNSLCLDNYGFTSNPGAAIDQWACNGQSNQQFQFVAGTGGYGELQVQNSGQDVTTLNGSTAQGQTDIVQEPANGSSTSQWLPQQQSDGSWQFENQASGLCLDVYGANSTQGQQLDLWPCKNSPGTNQDFKVQ